jgi:DNA-binding Lrp family transcriptional regulator
LHYANYYSIMHPPRGMALDPKQLAKLLQLRALGWSQQEIAEAIGVSRQVIGYQLKRLKKESEIKGTEEVFRSALIGGLAGATAGIGMFALLSELFKE